MTQLPGRRERKKAATRLALQEAAFKLFNERGYDATTVDDISDIADVSARTFFRYFPTKDDVLFGDHLLRLESLRTVLAERPAGEPLMTSIEAMLTHLSSDLQENRERVRLQCRLSGEKTHVLGAFRQHHEELSTVLVEFVASRIDKPDPHQMRTCVIAAAAMGTFLAAAREWALSDCAEDLDQLTDEAKAALRSVVAEGRL